MGMEKTQEELTTKVNNIPTVPCGFSLAGGDTPLFLYWTLIVCQVYTVPCLRRKPRQNPVSWSPETHRPSAESTIIGDLALLNLTWRRSPSTFTALDAPCRSKACEEEQDWKSQLPRYAWAGGSYLSHGTFSPFPRMSVVFTASCSEACWFPWSFLRVSRRLKIIIVVVVMFI